MYTFTPMTEEEIDSASLLTEGTYDFEVKKSIRKLSKSGNAMSEILVIVYDKDGKQHSLFDYLVFSQVPLCIRKVKHFCEAVGLIDQYNKGELSEDFGGYSGKLQIGISDEKPNPNGGVYPKKNIVIDYIKADNAKENLAEKKDEFFSDDVPF